MWSALSAFADTEYPPIISVSSNSSSRRSLLNRLGAIPTTFLCYLPSNVMQGCLPGNLHQLNTDVHWDGFTEYFDENHLVLNVSC